MGNYSVIKNFCTSNGPGVRTSIYLSGCRLRCKGCFNYEAWDFNSGAKVTDKVVDNVVDSLKEPYIQGLSILGGEPMDENNQETTLMLAMEVKEKYGDSKDIWLWTGYKIDKNLPQTKYTKDILRLVDVIVDGPFELDKQDITLQYAGSTNQRVLKRGVDF